MEASTVSRRAFIEASIGFLASAAYGKEDIIQKNINKKLLQMTKNLSGMMPVRKTHLVDGAVRGLINLEQCHWSADMHEDDVPIVHACQTEIRSALLDALKDNKDIAAYEEGRYCTNEGKDVSCLQTGYTTRPWRNEYSRIAQLGAMSELEWGKKLEVFSAEKEETYVASGNVPVTARREIWKKVVHEDREDALLDLIHKNNHRIAWTSFGYQHDFRDTIERWNKEHPTNTFSLVTMRPKSLQKMLTIIPFF